MALVASEPAADTLRERADDIPALVDHLLQRMRREVGRREITVDAVDYLAGHDWPGNVRQLVNVLRRVCARTDDTVVGAKAIREAVALEPSATVPTKITPTLAAVERRPLTDTNVEDALRAVGGSVAAAARNLGVPRSTLRDRLSLHRAGPIQSRPTQPRH